MPSGPTSESTALLRRPSVSSATSDRRGSAPPDRSQYGSVQEGGGGGGGGGGSGDDHNKLEEGDDVTTTWQAEVKILAWNSPPLIVTYLLQYSFTLVTVFVAGRLGTTELGATSLASMTAEVTGLCVYEGLATCLDTLTSQAYGNNRKQLVGLHVQRMCTLMTVATVPIGAVWLASPWLLPLIVPEADVAVLAGRFLQIYLLGAPGWAFFEAAKRFTQAQGNFHASLAVLLVCAPLNILLNWLFVFRAGLGFQGAALAAALSNNLQPVVFVLYVYLFLPDTLECWPGLQWRRLFENWGPMVRLGLPGIFMTAAEWTAFDVLTLASSYISKRHLAAQSVIMTVCVAIYHIPFPISIAASTRFGNLIGSGALSAASTAWKTYYVVFVVIGLMDLAILTSLRYFIAAVFTDDEGVRAIIASVLPVVASAQLFDALLAISNGLLRGLGRQKIGGWVNLGVYYLLAIPLSLVLTFGPLHLGLAGLWTGPCLGLGLGALSMGLYMKFTDWETAVADARAREE